MLRRAVLPFRFENSKMDIPLMHISHLTWRYAVKRFDSTRTIPPEIWEDLRQSMVLTPSSFGLQPWRFIVITSPEVKAKLPGVSWGQNQPADCSHMVVLAALKKVSESYVDEFLQTVCTTRNVTMDSLANYRKMILGFMQQKSDAQLAWATNQVYIALGQLMATAAQLGVDACPMEGINAAEYDRILGLETSDYRVVVGCALGYRHSEDKYALAPKVRFAPERVVQVV
jgi:nitroreductase